MTRANVPKPLGHEWPTPGGDLKIATASFFTYSGPGRISIARSCPRRTPKGFRGLRALAPGPWFKSTTAEEYLRLYRAQLSALNPRQITDQIHELAGGAERAVLLCWEINPSDRWDLAEPEDRPNCHRRIVAEWLEESMGLEVPELPAIVATDVLSGSVQHYDPATPIAPLSAAEDPARGYDEGDLAARGTMATATDPRFFALERQSGIWWPTEVARPGRSGAV